MTSKSHEVSGFSETLKGKRLELRLDGKDRARSLFESNLNRSADLNGNFTTPSSCECGKSVLASTIRLMNSEAEAKSD